MVDSMACHYRPNYFKLLEMLTFARFIGLRMAVMGLSAIPSVSSIWPDMQMFKPRPDKIGGPKKPKRRRLNCYPCRTRSVGNL